MLKEMGCNAIRTSHNPPAPELLDLCDRLGFVVMDEAFDCWERGKKKNDYHLLFDDWHEKDLRAQIRRDRNHPCVILWSIGNEITEQGSTDGHEDCRELAGQNCPRGRPDPARDRRRATTRRPASTAFRSTVDVFGYNYKPTEYGQFPPDQSDPAALRQRNRLVHQFARRIFLPREQQQGRAARPISR